MSRYAMCPTCGHRMKRYFGEYGVWDGMTYFCPNCSDDEGDDGESISCHDAALIWASSGMDEDYTFGYSENELEDELQ